MAEILVPLGFFGMVVCLVVGMPVARAFARKIDQQGKQSPLPSAEVIARLERIEQGIEAMATEVERITEGQRFTTKLLAERASSLLPVASSVAAPVTVDPVTPSTPDGTVLLPAARRP